MIHKIKINQIFNDKVDICNVLWVLLKFERKQNFTETCNMILNDLLDSKILCGLFTEILQKIM